MTGTPCELYTIIELSCWSKFLLFLLLSLSMCLSGIHPRDILSIGFQPSLLHCSKHFPVFLFKRSSQASHIFHGALPVLVFGHRYGTVHPVYLSCFPWEEKQSLKTSLLCFKYVLYLALSLSVFRVWNCQKGKRYLVFSVGHLLAVVHHYVLGQ